MWFPVAGKTGNSCTTIRFVTSFFKTTSLFSNSVLYNITQRIRYFKLVFLSWLRVYEISSFSRPQFRSKSNINGDLEHQSLFQFQIISETERGFGVLDMRFYRVFIGFYLILLGDN